MVINFDVCLTTPQLFQAYHSCQNPVKLFILEHAMLHWQEKRGAICTLACPVCLQA